MADGGWLMMDVNGSYPSSGIHHPSFQLGSRLLAATSGATFYDRERAGSGPSHSLSTTRQNATIATTYFVGWRVFEAHRILE